MTPFINKLNAYFALLNARDDAIAYPSTPQIDHVNNGIYAKIPTVGGDIGFSPYKVASSVVRLAEEKGALVNGFG
ncbi:hypothetical protein HGRIS_012098 [Hohenbuehelia grisea]|uniref:Uncharacterized protein n=1 Tax=Hohenbuehelia grisea TaxID=104357 RepID=A0ABR3IR95_9AGAR